MADTVLCPKCGNRMVVRSRKADGVKFYGCSTFPACNGTRSISNGGEPGSIFAKPENREFKPSKYQLAFFQALQELAADENIVVEALAGSGKTTSIAKACELLPHDKRIVVVVFNKHNVQPVKDKVPAWVKVCTYHSLGYAGCRKAFGNDIRVVENSDDKVNGILQGILNEETYGYVYPQVRQMVGLVKANLIGTSEQELSELADYYGIETNGDSQVIFEAVAKVVAKSAEVTDYIDYDDMCWLPVLKNIHLDTYDYVFVDEAQDTNKNQMALALASVADGGHIIAVGDRHQSMYGFRGADAQAIPGLIENLNAKVLPLSITYRNPQCVVDLVNQKFPEIGLEGTGKSGRIIYAYEHQASLMYEAGDMVLCRTNAPLVGPCFDLIRRGVKATIRGRDVSKGLLSLVKKMKATDVVDLVAKLTEYKDKEVEKLMAAKKNSQAQNLTDKVETVIALTDGVNTVRELEVRVKEIFSDKVEGVVFSSIHRAKGLESERVFILKPELLPHPMAKKEWEQLQERNIEYVALTRVLNTLVYVNGD